MTKDQKDNLFLLIKSLTKSEKRQFKLYVGRLEVNQDSKYLNLFNFLDKSKVYNESAILEREIVKKKQLANVKAHLYRQILISLKLNPSHQNIRSQIREQLDFASILYHKGLYKQSLKILDKSKEVAIQNEEKTLAYEIVELEKIIESQYITRKISTRTDELMIQSKELSTLNVISSKLSNLSLQLYGIILKSGYIKNETESKKIQAYFYERFPRFEFKELGFREKYWLYNVYLWYSFLLQDFKNCYRYALKWVDLFQEYPQMITVNPVFFLKGNNYLLEALFFIGNKEKFQNHLLKFQEATSKKKFPNDENVQALTFLYLNLNTINLYFIDGSFQEGVNRIPKIKKELDSFKNRLDEHHVMIFYYKFANMYFGHGNNKECIYYLDKIISNKSLLIREDLQCFARVLNLVAHYEAGLDYNIEALLKSTYKFLIKTNDLYEVQKEMIKFLRNLQYIYPQDIKKAFEDLRDTLKKYEDHPYERRAFLYLDVMSWLESKIQNVPIADVIRQKYYNKQ
ncbi:hypothetical protein [Psychroserpens sp.]|uniref:hypothetical protein n=1 Tax=Psychroserpens sp. TaxID=2020870 RepID=UPI002B27BB81|nr:hypothetical protein [Psychroserpens sp.]